MTKGQEILQLATRSNQNDDILKNAYNISSNDYFDAVIIAPTWTPYRVGGFPVEGITVCKDYTTIQKAGLSNNKTPMMKRLNESYILEWKGLRLGWLKTGTCAGNVIDSTLFLSNIKTDRLIFLGAVGGIVPNIALGDVITPSYCIDCVGATRYFSDNKNYFRFDSIVKPSNIDYVNRIIKIANQQGIPLVQRKTFCTDTILGEYLHIDKIKSVGAEVIEMETSAFYCAANLMEKASVAFLVVSDNSSIGKSISAPQKKDFEHYNQIIKSIIPELILIACKAEI